MSDENDWVIRLPGDMRDFFEEYVKNRATGFKRGTEYVKYVLRKEIETLKKETKEKKD